ncbi:polysaccharide-degrading enzyme [Fibrobacterota bacterium]
MIKFRLWFLSCLLFSFCTLITSPAWADLYEVGPGKSLSNVNDVPWEDISGGDTVLIYYRSDPYREKFAINNSGSENNPLVIMGVLGPNGERPVLDARNASARPGVPYNNQDRCIIKLQNTPQYVVIANLELTSARPGNSYTTSSGGSGQYRTNASAVYVETGRHLLFRNMVFKDCGNGFFSTGSSEDIVVEHSHFYENGIVGSIYEHNNYTSSNGILFQYNRFGALCDGCSGNSLKDRSAGTVVRYNWIESTNRMLDLVESGGRAGDPAYHETHVYGNIIIDDGSGNNFMVHYGGDNGGTSGYRKGTLYFYNNTCITTRSGTEMIIRGSTDDEHVEFVNNIVYASRGTPRILGNAGSMNAYNNWFVSGYDPGSGFSDEGGNVTGSDPGFVDFDAQDFRLQDDSPALNGGVDVTGLDGFQPLEYEYVSHQLGQPKRWEDAPDMGALEYVRTGGPVHNTWAFQQSLRFQQNISRSENVININYSLPKHGLVSLDVYNSLGRHVKTLVNSSMSAGNYTAVWNTQHFPAGTYYSTLKAGPVEVTKKAILMK